MMVLCLRLKHHLQVVFVLLSCSESRANRIIELIIEMIAIDMRPMRLVKCAGSFDLRSFLSQDTTFQMMLLSTKGFPERHIDF